MSENLVLHCQEGFHSRALNEEGREVANYLVTGLELADGTFIQGKGRTPELNLPMTTLPLSWETDKVARITNFYSRYLAEGSQPTDGWNCHKFVVDTMGWEVLWSEQAYPYHLIPGILAVKSAVLRDETPYAVKGTLMGKMGGVRILTHSMLGLPNPDYTLGVDGRNAGLYVMPHARIFGKYGSKFYKQYPPLVQKLGKAGRIFQPADAAESFPF